MFFKIKKLSFILFFLLGWNLFSQKSGNELIDSLKTIVKNQSEKEKVNSFINIAENYLGINLDSAKFYSNKAYTTALNTKDNKTIVVALLTLGNFYRENSEYQKAIQKFEEALEISQQINDTRLIANSHSGIGIVQSRLGNFREAIRNFYIALPIYEKNNDVDNIARCYLNLAVDLRKIKEFDQCIYYNNKAIAIFEKEKDLLNVAAINNNLGGVLNENKQYEKAIISAEKAKKYFSENEYVRYVAYPLTNIAISYDSLHQPKKAEENYLAAIKLHTKYREPYELAFLNNAYANLIYKQKNYTKALKTAKLAFDFAQEVKALEFISSSAKTLAKSYQKINDYKNANLYLNKHIAAKDSIFEREKRKDISEIQAKYETTKKEKEIAIQKEQLLAQQLKIKNKNVYAILITSALLILGIIFFAIFKRNQFKRKQLQKEINLKDALATIKTQNRLQEQRLRISRDLHDNIGSQLTFIISSLDNLKFISKEVSDALKSKITNISSFTTDTIHQLRDTIWAMNKTEISMEDLHTRILSFVEKAKLATTGIEFEVHQNITDQINFSSLKGMHLFRVIQEAINNAIKYAEASNIIISVNHMNNAIEINIKDNGKGFDINTTELGNGLSNMEARISEIEGKVFINSQINKGTEIQFIFSK